MQQICKNNIGVVKLINHKMRKKLSVDAIRRENGDNMKENQELPQIKPDKKPNNSDITETHVNGNHVDDDQDNENESFDEDDKDSSLDQDEEPTQQELP